MKLLYVVKLTYKLQLVQINISIVIILFIKIWCKIGWVFLMYTYRIIIEPNVTVWEQRYVNNKIYLLLVITSGYLLQVPKPYLGSIISQEACAVKEYWRELWVSAMFEHMPCQVVAPLGGIVADVAVKGHLRAAFT